MDRGYPICTPNPSSMSTSVNSQPGGAPPPPSASEHHIEEPDIGTTTLATTNDLDIYMYDNNCAIHELIHKEANFIRESINNGLKHITQYPYVLQTMIPRTPFGNAAWEIVLGEIHDTKPWGDTSHYQIIIQD